MIIKKLKHQFIHHLKNLKSFQLRGKLIGIKLGKAL